MLTTSDALTHNLKRLAYLRLITCVGIAIALVYLPYVAHHPPALTIPWIIWAALTALSFLNLIRAKQKVPERSELFAYLLTDSTLIIALIYFTGGANNPFITYLLVPIVISAATQSGTKTWTLCILSMAAYGLLLFYHEPLHVLHVHSGDLNPHIIGMLLTFVMSALFIAYFVVDMAQQLRQEQQQVAQLREESMQDEHLMVVASQSAATAHELGTPLTTVAVITQDLIKMPNLSTEERLADLEEIQQQIALCKDKLKQLVRYSTQESTLDKPLKQFIQDTLDQWLLMRPKAQYHWQDAASEPAQAPEQNIQYSPMLQQAIINLLNNAMDANPAKSLGIGLFANDLRWSLCIEDHGQGAPESVLKSAAAPHKSENGMGIGLLLSHSSIQRLGGTVELQNKQTGGCHTKIEVPFCKNAC